MAKDKVNISKDFEQMTLLDKKELNLKVLIMNAKGNKTKSDDDKSGSGPERKGDDDRSGSVQERKGDDNTRGYEQTQRRLTIKGIVAKHEPNLVLFQEFKTWYNIEKPKNYEFLNNEKNGDGYTSIMYDSDLELSDIGKIELPSEKLPKAYAFQPISRMCAKLISTAGKPKLICISWHGPHNKKNNGGPLHIDVKNEYFECLMEFLRNIRIQNPNVPILVGGDFNIAMDEIERFIESPFKLCKYNASERRASECIIDYFIFTDDLKLEDTEYIDLKRYSEEVNPVEILNHDPIITLVKASTSSTTEAAM